MAEPTITLAMGKSKMTLQEVNETRAEILNKYGGAGNPLANLMVRVCDRLIELMAEPETRKERGSLPFRGEA